MKSWLGLTKEVTLDSDGVSVLTDGVQTPLGRALSGGTYILQDGSGNFGAKVLNGGGFTRFNNGGRGDVLYETVGVAAIAIQLQMTRAAATTAVKGFWATVNMGGVIGTTMWAGTCRFFAQGRNNTTIQFINGPANLNITVTTVTQTSTNLTLKFAITGASGTWTEFTASIIADTPVQSGWTFTGSQVA